MDDAPYSLLIIDSIINCFRVDYVGRGELAIRQQTLNKHLNDIKKLAMEFNLGVVFTLRGGGAHPLTLLDDAPHAAEGAR